METTMTLGDIRKMKLQQLKLKESQLKALEAEKSKINHLPFFKLSSPFSLSYMSQSLDDTEHILESVFKYTFEITHSQSLLEI
jgi:hypothetical protein